MNLKVEARFFHLLKSRDINDRPAISPATPDNCIISAMLQFVCPSPAIICKAHPAIIVNFKFKYKRLSGL